jgi:murein DD-endopeptidase MepM/ murein hydrolase activator NlpD
MRLRTLVAGVAVPLLVWAFLPVFSSGASKARSAANLQSNIEKTRGKIGRKKGTERVLTSDIAAYSRRISRLQRKIGSLQTRQQRAQADLDAKQAELSRLQKDLRDERARLVRLRARLFEARQVLARRLVEIYQAGHPDLITVVMNAKGFADLLERGEFLRRINEQDTRIVNTVADARAEARATSTKLARLERRQAKVTAIVQQRRDEIAGVKQGLIDTRVGFATTKNGKRRALQKVRGDRHELEEDLQAMERQQAKIQAALTGPGIGAGLPVGAIKHGSGAMIWPVNGTFTSPFGYRWGRLHAGIDIAAPEGTPIRAALAGKVVLMQPVASSGGYGNYTCVQHTSTMSTCYAHQSRFGTSMGASLSKGQVLGYVGNTGHSFGAHLHFEVRINGQPVNPMGYL